MSTKNKVIAMGLTGLVALGVVATAVPASAATTDSTITATAAGIARASGYDVPARINQTRSDLFIDILMNINVVRPQVDFTFVTDCAPSAVTYAVVFSNPNPVWAGAIAGVNAAANAPGVNGSSLTEFETDVNPILLTVPFIPAQTTARVTLTVLSPVACTGTLNYQLFADSIVPPSLVPTQNPASDPGTVSLSVTRPSIVLPAYTAATYTAGGAVPNLGALAVDAGLLSTDAPATIDPARLMVSVDGATPITLAALTALVPSLAVGSHSLVYSYSAPDSLLVPGEVTALNVQRELIVSAALAATGVDSSALLAGITALLLAGGALMFAARRRRELV